MFFPCSRLIFLVAIIDSTQFSLILKMFLCCYLIIFAFVFYPCFHLFFLVAIIDATQFSLILKIFPCCNLIILAFIFPCFQLIFLAGIIEAIQYSFILKMFPCCSQIILAFIFFLVSTSFSRHWCYPILLDTKNISLLQPFYPCFYIFPCSHLFFLLLSFSFPFPIFLDTELISFLTFYYHCFHLIFLVAIMDSILFSLTIKCFSWYHLILASILLFISLFLPPTSVSFMVLAMLSNFPSYCYYFHIFYPCFCALSLLPPHYPCCC